MADEGCALAREALEQSERTGSRLTALRALGTLGFCDISDAKPDDAWRVLEPAATELQVLGVGEISIFGVAPDALEALAALGRLDEAAALADWIEAQGAAANRAWHRVVAARGRALVAAASGDDDGAREALAAAFAAHDELPQPFELGRTLLTQGRIDRRAKRWAAARRALVQALETFDAVGAGRWSEQAATELARVPGRGRSTEVGLSQTERRIAGLVADGLSNKEVAATMFISVRTVEANLSKVYAKLGVRSRTELARRLPRNDVDLPD